jgi:hypothetical protein
MQPRDTVIIDIEVLADKLAQQLVSSRDRFVVQQPLSQRDRDQRTLRVLRNTGQYPLPLGLLTPPPSGFSPGLA